MKRILLTLALVLSILSVSANTQQKPQQWEYKFEYKCTEKKANELAADGWELVTIGEGSTGIFSVCAFKRAK